MLEALVAVFGKQHVATKWLKNAKDELLAGYELESVHLQLVREQHQKYDLQTNHHRQQHFGHAVATR